MSDEDLRRELRESLVGSSSIRRLVEFGRLASALRAVLPTPEEERAWPEIIPAIVAHLPRFSVGSVFLLRRAFLDFRARGDLLLYGRPDSFYGFGAEPFYGRPAWLAALGISMRGGVDPFRESLPYFDPVVVERIAVDAFRPEESPQEAARRRSREKTRENVRRRPPRRLA